MKNTVYPEWKKNSKKYINELQKFLDLVDNIENQKLKNDVIYQMLNCDKILTQLAEEKINEIRNSDNHNK